jgi:hypothetical protein
VAGCALLLGACALPLGACAPGDLSGVVRAHVVAPLGADGRGYGLTVAEVERLESLRELRGEHVHLRAGTAFTMGLTDSSLERGRPFSLEYTQEADGTVVPADETSLWALSAYRHFDRAAAYLREQGHAPLQPLDVYYYPQVSSVVLGDLRSIFTDNAAYVFNRPRSCFLLVPSFALAELPLLLNAGVIAHEYGHAVVHQELFGEGNAPGLEEASWGPAHEHLNAMHEGVADLVALAVTGDPDFIAPSVRGLERDVSVPRALTAEDVRLLEAGESDVHVHGSTMARALYTLWPRSGAGGVPTPEERASLARGLLGALRTLRTAGRFTERFTLAALPDALVLELPPGERPAACAVLRAQLAPLARELTACEGL